MTGDAEFSAAVEAFQRGELNRALDCAERAVAERPTARWNHLLGLVHCRQGRPDLGVEPLRRAAEAEPGNAAFAVMFARSLIDSGRPAAVLRMRPPPTSPTPAELGLWHARAEAAAAIGDHARAAEAWSVISHSSGNPDGFVNLGRCLLALDRLEEAERAYREALAKAPADSSALYELGLLYERTNRLEALGQLLDDAVRAGVGKAELGLLWAVRELRSGDAPAAHEHLLTSDPARDPVRWHRLRARIADAEGDAASAFAAAVAMNQATPDFAEWRGRAGTYRAELRALAEMLSGEGAAQLPGLGSADGRAPVFLVGFPRSGTTLLDTFLMGHPDVTVLEEKEILRRAGEIVGPIGRLFEAPAATLEAARQAYLAELAQRVDPAFAGVVVDKHPLNMVAVPLIHALFPGTPIIFVQRHPCDSVLSGFMQSFTPNLGMASFLDLHDAADLYDAAMSVWSSAAAALPLNVRKVVYEELIDDPEPQLRRLLEFVGLPWDHRVLDHRATARDRGAIMNTSYDQVTEELNRRPIGRWRRYEEQLQPVLPILLRWAERLGYRD